MFRSDEGRVHEWSPGNGFSRSLESICERSKDLACSTEKLSVEIDYTKKPLETVDVCWLWKGGDGGGVLYQGRKTWGGETVAKELNFFNSKLAPGQANSKTIRMTEGKHIMEMLDVRG